MEGLENIMEVLVDDTLIANYTDTVTIANEYESY